MPGEPPVNVLRCHNPTRVIPGDGSERGRMVKPEVVELCGAPMRYITMRGNPADLPFVHCCECDSIPGPRVCNLCGTVKDSNYR